MNNFLTVKMQFYPSSGSFSMSFKKQLLAEHLFARGHEIMLINLIGLFP